jgi:hypothetical protein
MINGDEIKAQLRKVIKHANNTLHLKDGLYRMDVSFSLHEGILGLGQFVTIDKIPPYFDPYYILGPNTKTNSQE